MSNKIKNNLRDELSGVCSIMCLKGFSQYDFIMNSLQNILFKESSSRGYEKSTINCIIKTLLYKNNDTF